jgi:hypothetical protein
MAQISALTGTRWYLGEHQHLFPPLFALLIPGPGVPFFNSTPFDLATVGQGLHILSDNLIAFQVGN